MLTIYSYFISIVISVLDRKGAATHPTEYFIPPPQATPQLGKAPVPQPGLFLFFCSFGTAVCRILQVFISGEPQFTQARAYFFAEKRRVRFVSVIFHKNMHILKMNFYNAALAFLTLS